MTYLPPPPHPPQKKKKILSPSTTLISHIIVFRRYILGKLPFSNQVTTTCSHDAYKVLINRQQEPITLLSTNQFRLNLNFKGTFFLKRKIYGTAIEERLEIYKNVENLLRYPEITVHFCRSANLSIKIAHFNFNFNFQ